MHNHKQCAHKTYNLWHKAALACLLLLGVLLIIDHWNHVISALPYLVLLSCPLMHLFMHGGHHHHHDDKEESAKEHQHKQGSH
jgi:hypothetical protein